MSTDAKTRCICGHEENMHYAPSGACRKIVAKDQRCTCKQFRQEEARP